MKAVNIATMADVTAKPFSLLLETDGVENPQRLLCGMGLPSASVGTKRFGCREEEFSFATGVEAMVVVVALEASKNPAISDQRAASKRAAPQIAIYIYMQSLLSFHMVRGFSALTVMGFGCVA